MSQGAPPDVRLAHRLDLDGAHDPCVDAFVFEGVLQGEGVLHGGDHADVVGRGPVEALGGGRDAAEDVAAANDDGQLDAALAHTADVVGDLEGTGRVDRVAVAGQRLAAQLEQDPPQRDALARTSVVARPTLGHGSVLGRLAELEAHEPPHLDVLADHADQVGTQLFDRAVRVFDEGLLHETDLLEELVQLAVEHLLDDVVGLALGLLAVDGLLALDDLGGHFVTTHPQRAEAATCMARSWVNSRNGSLRATKSVSTPTSTSTPILPPAWM